MELKTVTEILPEAFFTVREQTLIFLLSIPMGIFLGVLYDVFRALRVMFPPLRKTIPTTVCDILYFQLCGICIYMFSLIFARGEIRAYYWLGGAIGGALYLLTAGTVVIGVIRRIFGVIFGIIAFIKRHAVKIWAKISTKTEKKVVSNTQKSKKHPKVSKKHLK